MEKELTLNSLRLKEEETDFMMKKSKQYETKINSLECTLSGRGFKPTIEQKAICDKSTELEELKQKLDQINAKIDSFAQLPPDINAAKAAVKEQEEVLNELRHNVDKLFSIQNNVKH